MLANSSEIQRKSLIFICPQWARSMYLHAKEKRVSFSQSIECWLLECQNANPFLALI